MKKRTSRGARWHSSKPARLLQRGWEWLALHVLTARTRHDGLKYQQESLMVDISGKDSWALHYRLLGEYVAPTSLEIFKNRPDRCLSEILQVWFIGSSSTGNRLRTSILIFLWFSDISGSQSTFHDLPDGGMEQTYPVSESEGWWLPWRGNM